VTGSAPRGLPVPSVIAELPLRALRAEERELQLLVVREVSGRTLFVGWQPGVDQLHDRRLLRPVILLRGLPATAGSLRRFQADSRAGSERDEQKPAVVMSKTYSDLQDFYGSDGLEPATSGVTGRSWRLRAERGYAGIPGERRPFRPCRRGDSRARAGASGVLLRDERGIRRCPIRKRTEQRFLLKPGALGTKPCSLRSRTDRRRSMVDGRGREPRFPSHEARQETSWMEGMIGS
jgi:hypothetical protein